MSVCVAALLRSAATSLSLLLVLLILGTGWILQRWLRLNVLGGFGACTAVLAPPASPPASPFGSLALVRRLFVRKGWVGGGMLTGRLMWLRASVSLARGRCTDGSGGRISKCQRMLSVGCVDFRSYRLSGGCRTCMGIFNIGVRHALCGGRNGQVASEEIGYINVYLKSLHGSRSRSLQRA